VIVKSTSIPRISRDFRPRDLGLLDRVRWADQRVAVEGDVPGGGATGSPTRRRSGPTNTSRCPTAFTRESDVFVISSRNSIDSSTAVSDAPHVDRRLCGSDASRDATVPKAAHHDRTLIVSRGLVLKHVRVGALPSAATARRRIRRPRADLLCPSLRQFATLLIFTSQRESASSLDCRGIAELYPDGGLLLRQGGRQGRGDRLGVRAVSGR
jgi:hypothetical protein